MSYDLGTARGTIELEYTGRQAVDRADNDMDRLTKSSKKTDKSFKDLGTRLKNFASGVGKATLWTGIGVGLGNAAVQAANFGIQIAGAVPALTSLLSLSAAIPGALVAGAAALATMKLVTAGLDEAFKNAFDPKKAKAFNDSLKNLSPSAAAFARAIKEVAPGLKTFQKGVQEAFFSSSGLAKAVPTAVGALHQIRPSIEGIARDFGGITKQVVGFATSGESVTFVQKAIAEFRNALRLVTPVITPILAGLRSVGTVGLPLMTQLGTAVSRIGTQFANWLSAIAADGRLQEWIDTALQTLGTLGSIAKNVGTILQNIFQIAGETGGGLLNTIAQITGEFARFVSSAEGGEQIRALFTGIGQAAAALAPVLTTLVGALAGALGPALATLATNLGPVLLEVVQALAPAFGPLAQGIADAASAIAPLLPPLAQLVALLATALGGALSGLASALGPVIEMFGGAFSAALQTLMPLMIQLIQQVLPQAAAFGQQLLVAFAPLVPTILQLAQQLATSLIPQLPKLMEAVQILLPAIIQLATAVSSSLNIALQNLIPLIPIIVGLVVGFVTGMAQMYAIVFKVIAAVISFANTLSTFASTIPGRVAGALSALGSKIASVFTNAWQTAVRISTERIGFIVGVARSLPGKVVGAISALVGLLGSLMSRAWNFARSAVSSGINSVVSLAGTVRGRILSAIGNLASALAGAGRDAVNGLISGLRSGIGAAADVARSLGSSIMSSIRSTLKIGSPSKEMIKIGRFVTQGLVIGLNGTAKQVQAASNKLANYVKDAFSDKLISRTRRNTVLTVLKAGTRQLLGLVNQSNTVAAKLKVAQKNLAAVQKQYNDVFASAVAKTQQSFALVTSGQQFVNLDFTKRKFQDAVKQAKDFAANINTLTKRGLNKDLLQQLADAGAADGSAMARALASASDATLKEFNALQVQLTGAANSVGKATAEAMFGAGLRAAEGLVAGLQKQQASIQKAMDRIADGMVARIKRALKIKSPSRVMFNLGKFTSQGLHDGIESLRKQVQRAAERLATASIIPTMRLTTNQSAATSTGQPSVLPPAGGTSYVLNQTVNALPGMDARQVAGYSASKLSVALKTGVTAVSLPVPLPQGA